MANPNIRELVSMTGNTAVMNATTVFANLVSNAAASGSIYRVVFLTAANITDAFDANVSIDLVRSSASYSLIKGVTVPYNASVAITTKDSAFYLIEGDTIQCKASSNANVQIICSYEVLS